MIMACRSIKLGRYILTSTTIVFSEKTDFESCADMPGFRRPGHISVFLCVCISPHCYPVIQRRKAWRGECLINLLFYYMCVCICTSVG